MFNKIVYRPDHALKLGVLTVSIIIGLIIAFITDKAIFLFLLSMLSQYHLLLFAFQYIFYTKEIKALERLVTSAGLTDKADKYTTTWYRASALLTLSIEKDCYILTVNANGISNTTNIDKLANEVGSAFHHSAFLTKVGTGYATYHIDLNHNYQEVHDSEF